MESYTISTTSTRRVTIPIREDIQEKIKVGLLVKLKTTFKERYANVIRVTKTRFVVRSHDQKYELIINKKYFSEVGDKKQTRIISLVD